MAKFSVQALVLKGATGSEIKKKRTVFEGMLQGKRNGESFIRGNVFLESKKWSYAVFTELVSTE